jgi:hypothetical protein
MRLPCHGRPNACDLWPYNTTNVKALVQVADRRYIDCRNAD